MVGCFPCGGGENDRLSSPVRIAESFFGSGMLLTKHEGVTFQNQTVYISGQAFIRCSFLACTLVLRETVYYLEGCTFDRCNWHVDRVLMWGSPESVQEVKALIAMIESVQAQQAQSAPPAGSAALTEQAPFVTANSGGAAPQTA